MAPKFKFTKEEILEVTLDFIRINGIKEISARTIARELNASTKVIFSLFGNMENLIREVNQLARNEFLHKVKISLKDESPFKRLGIEYILFSKNEPKLFEWLFMNKSVEIEDFKDFLPMYDYEYKKVIESIVNEYKISIKSAEKFYTHLFTYSHGIATLSVTGIYSFTEIEIREVNQLARNEFLHKVKISLKDESPFKRLGIEYILFSKNEPKLFEWLFMNKSVEIEDFKDFLPMYDYEYKKVIESIVNEYKISIKSAEKFYTHLFTYSHGIATLSVTGIYSFTEIEIIEATTEIARSLVKSFLKENN